MGAPGEKILSAGSLSANDALSTFMANSGTHECLETDLAIDWCMFNPIVTAATNRSADFPASIDPDLFLMIYCGWIVTISRFITCLSRFFLFGISFRVRLS
jgi:hypothetical protein